VFLFYNQLFAHIYGQREVGVRGGRSNAAIQSLNVGKYFGQREAGVQDA